MESQITENFKKELDILGFKGGKRCLPPEPTSNIVNLSSNDYLGIAANGKLWEQFSADYPFSAKSMGSCSSRLLTGNCSEYETLEKTLQDGYRKGGALVFNSGYHANAGILPALAGKGDLVLADKLVHASIIDGMKLCSATSMRFRHLDYGHLEALISKNKGVYNNLFIVTESIFSMDGDKADLDKLVEIKKKYGAILYVDEAHAIGVAGKKGLGLCEDLNLVPEIDLLVGTFGKAVASLGAFTVCSPIIREYLVNHCRSLIFTTALPPISLAWTNFVLNRLPNLREERTRLEENSRYLATLLGMAHSSHIIPYICGSNERAVELSKKLEEVGILVLPIRHPTVPEGTARLRFSLSAHLTKDQLYPIKTIIDAYRMDK